MLSEQDGSSAYGGTGSYGQVNIIYLMHQKLKIGVLVLTCTGFYITILFLSDDNHLILSVSLLL